MSLCAPVPSKPFDRPVWYKRGKSHASLRVIRLTMVTKNRCSLSRITEMIKRQNTELGKYELHMCQ